MGKIEEFPVIFPAKDPKRLGFGVRFAIRICWLSSTFAYFPMPQAKRAKEFFQKAVEETV
jgi:hypothetical protein